MDVFSLGRRVGVKELFNVFRGYCGVLEVWYFKVEEKMVILGFICFLGVGVKGLLVELVLFVFWKG